MIKNTFTNGVIDYSLTKTLWIINDNNIKENLFKNILMIVASILLIYFNKHMIIKKKLIILFINVIQIFKSIDILKDNLICVDIVNYIAIYLYLNLKLNK